MRSVSLVGGDHGAINPKEEEEDLESGSESIRAASVPSPPALRVGQLQQNVSHRQRKQRRGADSRRVLTVLGLFEPARSSCPPQEESRSPGGARARIPILNWKNVAPEP